MDGWIDRFINSQRETRLAAGTFKYNPKTRANIGTRNYYLQYLNKIDK